jgi:hypothetical protein
VAEPGALEQLPTVQVAEYTSVPVAEVGTEIRVDEPLAPLGPCQLTVPPAQPVIERATKGVFWIAVKVPGLLRATLADSVGATGGCSDVISTVAVLEQPPGLVTVTL